MQEHAAMFIFKMKLFCLMLLVVMSEVTDPTGKDEDAVPLEGHELPDEALKYSVRGNSDASTDSHEAGNPPILMISEVIFDDSPKLNLLTMMGLALSIVCLSATFVVYKCFRMTSTRTLNHANLALSLMAIHIAFVFFDTTHSVACIAVAVSFHFFLQATFTWLTLEGVIFYIQSKPRFRLTIRQPAWLLTGWGCPAFALAVSVAVRWFGFTGPGTDSCWLSYHDEVVWAILAPAICVLFINTLVLIRLVCVSSPKDESEATRIKVSLRLILVLEPLLGVPWIFCLLYAKKGAIFFAHAFVTLNSLQGAFLLFYDCLFNREDSKTVKPNKPKSEVSDTRGDDQPEVQTSSKCDFVR